MNQRIKFNISVSFGRKRFRIGAEVNSDEIPKRIFKSLLKNGVIEIISEDAEEIPEVFVQVPPWPLQTPPDQYLKDKPDGPNADLARQILGIE